MTRYTQLAGALSSTLQDFDDAEILTYFDLTLWFAESYAFTYELPGPILLVLDNSLIQAFKHRHVDRKRALHVLAYETFCRFVREWSDRESHLALSPMAIYEHIGRRLPSSVSETERILDELELLLRSTQLRITLLGYETPDHLFDRLQEIAADEVFLTRFVEEIDKAGWKVDLSAPIGVKIPMSEAWRSLPELLPLKYFDPWYVRFVLSARIESHIIKQCKDQDPAPIDSGRLSKVLAKLNTFGRNGLLKGLGDIDLFQICDISRQYQQKCDYVLAGQTLDRDLAETLRHRHVYSVSAEFKGGDLQRKQSANEIIGLILGRPFFEEKERGKWIREQLIDFLQNLAVICKKSLREAPASNK